MLEQIELMRERLNYDPETGVLTYSSKAKGNKRAGDKVGCIDGHGYIKVMFQGRMYYAHRMVWMMINGRAPAGVIDHINGIKTDNRIANLRESSISQNGANSDLALRGGELRGTTKLKSGRFQSQIKREGKAYYLGSYSTREDARTAYEFASILVFKEFSPFHPARTQALKGQ